MISETHYPTTCFRLNGILLVPHYTKLDIFVGPGYRESPGRDVSWTEADLLGLGAQRTTEHLWKRNWQSTKGSK